ncbi:hypothetical protein [Thermofilum adornatum]|uniref:hypothetical protein n=1 Tax=Thermofilum adornatum TaxID=1365176 RepID=UPI0011E4FD59|nr:hypothetical protein [Thermofilum adornatum]
MSKGGVAGSVRRAVMRSEILLVTLVIFLASLLSFIVAIYVYYPWPEKLVIHSSLIAFSFFIAVWRPGKQLRILLRLPRRTVALLLVAGFVALVVASIIPIPWLALFLALMYAAPVVGVSLAEALKLRGIFDDAVGFALFSFIIGSTFFGVIALGASLFLGFPGNRYAVLVLVALHTIHVVGIYSKKSKSQLIEMKGDSLLFISSWLTLIYNFYLIYYPNDVYLPGEDMLRHYMWSVNLVRNPWKFLSLSPDNYLVFHSFEGGLMLLANCYDAPLLNSVLLPVALLSTLALAQLTANVAGNPASRNIALILPFVFSGLGWLYLLLNRPASPAAYFAALASGSEKVYRNLMYIPFPLMWPVPQPFSVAAFLLFLSLLLKMVKLQGTLPGSAVAAGLLMFSMLSTHPPQGIMAAALLTLLALLWGKSLSSALKPICLGAHAGALAGGALNMATVYLALQGAPRLENLMLLRVAAFFAPALAAAAALALSSFGIGLEPLFARLAKRLRVRAPVASALGTFLLILGVSVALDPSNTFATSRADPGWVVGLVPWFIYAILLGAALPLGLYGYELLAREGSKAPVAVLGLLAALAVAVGRTLGFFNASGIDTGYWGEKRFVLFVYIALAPPAAYALERLARGRSLRVAILSLLLALLAVNAAVSASYWGITSERGRISDTEKAAFDKLGELLWANPNRWVFSPTLRSRDASAFAAPIYYVFADPSYSWRWQVPELSLAIFRARNLDPPYVYINWATNSQPARSGWIGRILLPRLPKLFSVGSIDVYDAPLLAPPVPNGSVALAIPPVWDESVDEAYLLLSLAGVNFTSVLGIDPSLYSYRVIVLPYDTSEENRTVTIDLLSTPIAFTSGSVNLDSESVELGGRQERLGNIVVWRNPFYLFPEAINVTVRFEVREYNPKVLNYFYFIYDFKDEGNYRYVGVMFTEQNKVYMLNCLVTNGKAYCIPAWPGIFLGNIDRVTGDHLLNLSFNFSKRELCTTLDALNRTCFNISFSGGSIGVRVDRFWAVKVKEMFITTRIRNYLNLERLKAENRTLIVFQRKPVTNETGEIRYGENLTIYGEQILDNKTHINSTFIPERYYSEINYANLVASNITFYNLSLTASNLLVIPLDSLRVYQHNKIQNLTSVRYLIIESPSEKVLNAFYVQANVKGGIGFYAKLEADRMYVPNGNVSVYFDDGVISELKGDLLFEGKFLVLARRPIFTAQRSVIRGVFGQSLLYPYLARDLIVIGNATFRFVRGDDSFLYFFVDASNSKIMFDPSLNIYSEWESVPLVLKYSYWIIVIICVFIAKRLQRLLKRRRP